jgi:hypothetical protein
MATIRRPKRDVGTKDKKKARKELIYKALTEPKFRRMLTTSPQRALGMESLSKIQLQEIQLILATVKGIETQINAMADKLLCNNGGPCAVSA